MRWRWRLVAGVAALLGVSCSPRAGQAPLPGLPQLELSSLPASVRDEIQRAYDAAQASPRSAEASGRLGMMLHSYSQYAFAEAAYQRARWLDPERFDWIYYLGTVQALDGKSSAAAESLRAALRMRPGHTPARLRLADTLLALGQSQESRQIYTALSQSQPALAQAHYGLGRVLSAEGDWQGAVGHLRRACELAPRYGAAHYALALALQKLGEPGQAKEHLATYQKMQRVEPRLEDPLLDAVKELNSSALAHLRNGTSLEAAGRLEEALAEHQKALEQDPNLLQAHLNLIILYGKLQQPERGVEHYKTAVELNPNLAQPHYNFGVLLYGQKRHAEAAKAFRRALELDPNYAEAHNNLGFVLESSGRVEEALRHYESAVRSSPGYRLAHFHLGRALLSRGRNREAIEHFRRTLQPEDQDTPRYLYALAAAYARSGDRQNALHYGREAHRQATSLGQSNLLPAIERDLRTLERHP